MTPNDLIASFEKLGEAPNGVERLRELVLQLAVQGKLVPQEPSDTVDRLLDSLEEQRAALIGQKRLRRPRGLPPVTEDEAPFEIPDTWRWARCQDLFLVVTDGDHQAPPKTPSGIPFLVIGNVSSGTIDFSETRFVGNEYFDGLDWIRRPAKGDVLYTVTGSFGIVLIVDTDQPFCVQRHIGILKSADGPSAAYLRIALQSPASRDYATEKATGTAQKTVSLTTLRSMPIPVPPLAEQHRIAARVNELMALLDRLEAARAARDGTRQAARDAVLAALGDADDNEETEVAWTRFVERLHDLVAHPDDIPLVRQTVLELAVRGKLVPQHPEDEPAKNLIERLAAIKDELLATTKRRRARAIPDLADMALPFDAPEGWTWSQVDAVCDIGSGVTKGRKLAGREVATFPYLRVANVQAGHLALETMKHIDIPVEEYPKYALEDGDVLLTEGGDWDKLGRSAIWRSEIARCIHQNHIFKARSLSKKDVLPEWLSMFTNSPVGRAYFQSCAKQTTNLASINKTELRACPLPVPPPREQRRIIARVDELMGLLDRLEHQLTEATSTHAAFAAAAIHHLDA